MDHWGWCIMSWDIWLTQLFIPKVCLFKKQKPIIRLVFSFYRWEIWGSERLCFICFTQQISSSVEIRIGADLLVLTMQHIPSIHPFIHPISGYWVLGLHVLGIQQRAKQTQYSPFYYQTMITNAQLQMKLGVWRVKKTQIYQCHTKKLSTGEGVRQNFSWGTT